MSNEHVTECCISGFGAITPGGVLYTAEFAKDGSGVKIAPGGGKSRGGELMTTVVLHRNLTVREVNAFALGLQILHYAETGEFLPHDQAVKEIK